MKEFLDIQSGALRSIFCFFLIFNVNRRFLLQINSDIIKVYMIITKNRGIKSELDMYKYPQNGFKIKE